MRGSANRGGRGARGGPAVTRGGGGGHIKLASARILNQFFFVPFAVSTVLRLMEKKRKGY